MLTTKYRRYLVLLEKQQATRNYLIIHRQKLEDSIAYDNIVIELDSLTYFFQKELKLYE